MRAHRPPDDADTAVATVLRVAVLLQAGVSPVSAWRHLAAVDTAAAAVCRRVDDGGSLTEALSAGGGIWVGIAAAWGIATTVGAPLADSLRSLAGVLADARSAADDARVALTEPAATARLLLWLPPVGLLLGLAFGFDTVAVLLGTPTGLACLVGGVALLLGARRWTRFLVRRAQPSGEVPGLHAELTAIALSGGASIDRASALVVATGTPACADTDEVLLLSRSIGVPAVELLRASAAHARHKARTDSRVRAAALSSGLVLPLGVCTLPAFLLLGVVPLVLSVLSTTSLPI